MSREFRDNDLFCIDCLRHESFWTGGGSWSPDMCPCNERKDTVCISWRQLDTKEKRQAMIKFNEDWLDRHPNSTSMFDVPDEHIGRMNDIKEKVTGSFSKITGVSKEEFRESPKRSFKNWYFKKNDEIAFSCLFIALIAVFVFASLNAFLKPETFIFFSLTFWGPMTFCGLAFLVKLTDVLHDRQE